MDKHNKTITHEQIWAEVSAQLNVNRARKEFDETVAESCRPELNRTTLRLLTLMQNYEMTLVNAALYSHVQLNFIREFAAESAKLYRAQKYEEAADLFYAALAGCGVIQEDEAEESPATPE